MSSLNPFEGTEYTKFYYALTLLTTAMEASLHQAETHGLDGNVADVIYAAIRILGEVEKDLVQPGVN